MGLLTTFLVMTGIFAVWKRLKKKVKKDEKVAGADTETKDSI